jgi:hypothetical protein
MRDLCLILLGLWMLAIVGLLYLAFTAPMDTEIWENGEPRG